MLTRREYSRKRKSEDSDGSSIANQGSTSNIKTDMQLKNKDVVSVGYNTSADIILHHYETRRCSNVAKKNINSPINQNKKADSHAETETDASKMRQVSKATNLKKCGSKKRKRSTSIGIEVVPENKRTTRSSSKKTSPQVTKHKQIKISTTPDTDEIINDDTPQEPEKVEHPSQNPTTLENFFGKQNNEVKITEAISSKVTRVVIEIVEHLPTEDTDTTEPLKSDSQSSLKSKKLPKKINSNPKVLEGDKKKDLTISNQEPSDKPSIQSQPSCSKTNNPSKCSEEEKMCVDDNSTNLIDNDSSIIARKKKPKKEYGQVKSSHAMMTRSRCQENIAKKPRFTHVQYSLVRISQFEKINAEALNKKKVHKALDNIITMYDLEDLGIRLRVKIDELDDEEQNPFPDNKKQRYIEEFAGLINDDILCDEQVVGRKDKKERLADQNVKIFNIIRYWEIETTQSQDNDVVSDTPQLQVTDIPGEADAILFRRYNPDTNDEGFFLGFNLTDHLCINIDDFSEQIDEEPTRHD